MSDDPRSPSDTPTATYRTEAHNRSDAHDGSAQRRFDFRLTRTDETSTLAATVVDLLAAYLGAAGHQLDTSVELSPRVAKVAVEGSRRLPNDADPALVSLDATVHVETSLSSDTLETWRTDVRDAAATQRMIPSGVPFSLRVTPVG